MQKLVVGIAALSLISVGPAVAQQTTEQARLVPAAATTSAELRPVLICADDDATRRAFASTYGEARYVTAEQVRAAAAAGETWSTPRCITEQELSRYRDARLKAAATR